MFDTNMPRGQHYAFAHRIIPQVFFGDPPGFMNFLERDGDVFLRFYWDRIGEKVPGAYDRVDGGALHGELRDLPGGFRAALIALPEPIAPTEAYFIAAAYASGLDGKIAPRYYTLEFGISVFDSEPYTVLGGWVPGGHINMGDGPRPELEAFVEAVIAKLAGDEMG